MAGRTNDPFADPNISSSQALDANPFSDPSIKNALSSDASPYEEITEPELDYSGYSQGAASVGGSGNAEAVREEELRRREQELERRERELSARQEHIKKHGRNNWPPFFPLIYHDILEEIPAASQSTMTNLYRLWLFLVLVLIFNLVSCIILLISGASDGGKDLAAAIMYLPVITVTSFLLWYRPIYNGLMKEHSLFYMYFVFCGFHLLFSIYMVVGIPSTGSAGLINTIDMFGKGKLLAGIFGAITTVGWALQGIGFGWYYKTFWDRHNQQGHTFAKAKAELATHGAKAYFTRGSQV